MAQSHQTYALTQSLLNDFDKKRAVERYVELLREVQ